jgi:hypothetical protein
MPCGSCKNAVSEEFSASTIRATRVGELPINLALTSNRRTSLRVVVDALRHKPDVGGSGPDVIFTNLLNFCFVLCPEVYSVSNRNDYQRQIYKFLGVERGRCVKVTTASSSMSRFSRECEILNISQPYRIARPVTGTALLFYL